jgi:hypothetical protein
MARRRAILGVLGNFLSAFGSRYSDRDGWWLFGLLVPELGVLEIGLLDDPPAPDRTPVARFAAHRAREVFSKQAALAGVNHHVREATVTLSRRDTREEALVNGHFRPAFEIDVTARAVTDLGTVYEKKRTLVVAAHDPGIEHRSIRRLTFG